MIAIKKGIWSHSRPKTEKFTFLWQIFQGEMEIWKEICKRESTIVGFLGGSADPKDIQPQVHMASIFFQEFHN